MSVLCRLDLPRSSALHKLQVPVVDCNALIGNMVNLFLNVLTPGDCRERKSSTQTDLKREWRGSFYPRVNSMVVTSDFNYGLLWPDGLVPRKQAVAPERAQRPLEVAAEVEARRRLGQAAEVVAVH